MDAVAKCSILKASFVSSQVGAHQFGGGFRGKIWTIFGRNFTELAVGTAPPHPGCQSPGGDYSIFSRESQPKPSFVTVTAG